MKAIAIGHNCGPPLDDYRGPEWGKRGIKRYFEWRTAHRRAWKKPREIALFRLEKAERCGLDYEEYTLEILERGRRLQPEDVEAVAAVKARRKRRR